MVYHRALLKQGLHAGRLLGRELHALAWPLDGAGWPAQLDSWRSSAYAADTERSWRVPRDLLIAHIEKHWGRDYLLDLLLELETA